MKTWFSVVVGIIILALIVGGLILFGSAPPWLDPVVGFFEGFSAEQLIATLVIAVIFLWPNAGVAFLNWIKNILKLEDDAAHKAVILILTVFSVITLALTGAFSVDGLQLTFGNIVYFVGEAYLLSQFTYKKLTGGI